MYQTQLLLLSIFGLVHCQSDNKWVWEKNSRANKLQDDTSASEASARYQIFEPDEGDYDYDRPPFRPGVQRPQSGIGPLPNGQIIGGGQFPNRPPYYPDQGNYPHFPGRPPVQNFDTCSCTERFNCKSPGLSYGHCDAGKSYCCYNKHGGLELGPAPSRPIQSPANGILVGPGGGGHQGYGSRPDFNRPQYPIPQYARPQGILVGPGGPTGIIGRPGRPGGIGGLRPIHSAENGILVGPGGPHDRPYGGPYHRPPFGIYPRSANKQSEVLSDAADSNDDKKI